MTTLTTGDTPKALREALCVAEHAVNSTVEPQNQHGAPRILAALIRECDRHRPTGPDGTHGDRHTMTCGCEDVPTGLLPNTPWSPEDARDRNAVVCALDAMADEADAAAARGIEPVLNAYLAGSLRMRAAFIRTGVIPAIHTRVPRMT
jgi:hypothetical protein